MPQFISDRRLYLNTDKSAVVEEGDPQAAYLLVAEGGTVSAEDARTFGIKAPKHADDEPEADTKAVSKAEVSDKSIKGPRSSKSD